MFLLDALVIGIPSFATKTASTAPLAPTLMLLILRIQVMAQRLKILHVIPPWVEQKSFFPTPQHALHRRQQPQSPSCRAKRPQQSCLIVKSLEDSIHSVGLSHRRPSGKAIHRSSHPSTTTIGTSTCTGNSSHIDDDLSISFKTNFKTIEVREYPLCIGDNPSVSDPDGPPLQLCWEPDCELSIAIDEFEEYRNGSGQDCVARRRGEDLRLNFERRKYMALQSGHTHQEIASVVRQVNRDRRRRTSAGRSNFFDTAKESAGRKLKRLVLRQKKDSELGSRRRIRNSTGSLPRIGGGRWPK